MGACSMAMMSFCSAEHGVCIAHLTLTWHNDQWLARSVHDAKLSSLNVETLSQVFLLGFCFSDLLAC